MLTVKELEKADYVHAYTLMKKQNFPQLPPCFKQAFFYFCKARLLGVFKQHKLIACVLFFKTDEGSYCVDGVCHPSYHGKWATRNVMKHILKYAFDTLLADFLWTESNKFMAQKFTRKLGFKQVCLTKYGELSVLTRQNIKKGLL